MKKIIIGITIILSIGIFTGCGCKKKEEQKKEEVKVNTNKDVVKDQTVEEFEFVNTSLKYENGTSILETAVTNNSDKTQELKEFKIHVKDKDGNEIITLTGYVGSTIKSKETKIINSYCGEDLSSAKSVEYEVIR